jgi:hypothetical protein
MNRSARVVVFALGASLAVGCASRSFNTAATAATAAIPATGAIPDDSLISRAPSTSPIDLPHAVCEALAAAGQDASSLACLETLGASQSFALAILPSCVRAAKRRPGHGTAALEALDCLRASSDAPLDARAAQSCEARPFGPPTKDASGRCLSGALDPVDCLGSLGSCLRQFPRVGDDLDDAVADVIALPRANELVAELRAAVVGDNHADALDALHAISRAGEESRPRPNDLAGVAAGYGPEDGPVAWPGSLPLTRDPSLAARTFHLEVSAVEFCRERGAWEDCARAIANFEFSSADLATCAGPVARGREVSCLIAVRQVHRKGHTRRGKLQADAAAVVVAFETSGRAAALATLERLEARLVSIR